MVAFTLIPVDSTELFEPWESGLSISDKRGHLFHQPVLVSLVQYLASSVGKNHEKFAWSATSVWSGYF